jgi:RNA polymerase sigma-70 factor (ECF subfamily)
LAKNGSINATDDVTGDMPSEDAANGVEASDEGLMERVAKGDRVAYAILVKRHANRFLAMAERILGNRQEAEDQVQHAFTRLWVHAAQFNPQTARFSTWFYKIVTNACTDHLRKKKTVPLAQGWDAEDGALRADKKIEQAEQNEALRQALMGLSQRQRIAITLCYFDELSNHEAARIMGTSIKALESLLVRGRVALRQILAEDQSA